MAPQKFDNSTIGLLKGLNATKHFEFSTCLAKPLHCWWLKWSPSVQVALPVMLLAHPHFQWGCHQRMDARTRPICAVPKMDSVKLAFASGTIELVSALIPHSSLVYATLPLRKTSRSKKQSWNEEWEQKPIYASLPLRKTSAATSPLRQLALASSFWSLLWIGFTPIPFLYLQRWHVWVVTLGMCQLKTCDRWAGHLSVMLAVCTMSVHTANMMPFSVSSRCGVTFSRHAAKILTCDCKKQPSRGASSFVFSVETVSSRMWLQENGRDTLVWCILCLAFVRPLP